MHQLQASNSPPDANQVHLETINIARNLNQAALDGEESVAKALATLLESRVLPASERVYELCRSKSVVPAVEVFVPKLQNYDALLNHSDRQELRYESAYETNRT
ncbi:MAG: hypothetical protein IPL73_24195 [Candidatus Obscuribacter sp.]|nr:hypothetical protein [Candidatus Obscuribacter sp.]